LGCAVVSKGRGALLSRYQCKLYRPSCFCTLCNFVYRGISLAHDRLGKQLTQVANTRAQSVCLAAMETGSGNKCCSNYVKYQQLHGNLPGQDRSYRYLDWMAGVQTSLYRVLYECEACYVTQRRNIDRGVLRRVFGAEVRG
jgi:hypothetical protein